MARRAILPSPPSKSKTQKKKRCPNGSRKDKKTGRCIRKRCPKGTRKNKKTKKCEPY